MTETYSADAPTREEVDAMQGAVVIEFGTSWCGWCRGAQPHIAQALAAGARMVRLDNMDLPTLNEAVRLNRDRAILEISGGVTLETVRALAETGVDRISIGALTKDVKATDYSMRFAGI